MYDSGSAFVPSLILKKQIIRVKNFGTIRAGFDPLGYFGSIRPFLIRLVYLVHFWTMGLVSTIFGLFGPVLPIRSSVQNIDRVYLGPRSHDLTFSIFSIFLFDKVSQFIKKLNENP